MTPSAAVEEAGGFCEDVVATEDYDLWIRIVEQGYRVVANRRPLVVYRLGRDAISADVLRVARGLQLTYMRALERENLTPRQRRIARRSLRLSRGQEKLEVLRAERRRGGRPLLQFVRSFPTLALVTAENPRTWPVLARKLVRLNPPLSR
jgi:cellulose synthase/poly-beta-1,6-N-acetylglucosamine synthase-like glycosyltransferase